LNDHVTNFGGHPSGVLRHPDRKPRRVTARCRIPCQTGRVTWTHFVIDMVLLIAWLEVVFTALRKSGWRLWAGLAAMFVLQVGRDVYDRRSTTSILVTVAAYLIGIPAVMGLVTLYRRHKRRTVTPQS
jgi:hypothetical protein